MEFDKFIEWGFMGVVGGGITWSATILQKIQKNISDLNSQVAVILEKTKWHEKEIEQLKRSKY